MFVCQPYIPCALSALVLVFAVHAGVSDVLLSGGVELEYDEDESEDAKRERDAPCERGQIEVLRGVVLGFLLLVYGFDFIYQLIHWVVVRWKRYQLQ